MKRVNSVSGNLTFNVVKLILDGNDQINWGNLEKVGEIGGKNPPQSLVGNSLNLWILYSLVYLHVY